MHKEGNAEPQGFLMCRYHAQNEDREMIIGYARVSTDGQTLDAQQSALAAAGAEKVFAEKVSGAMTDRIAVRKFKGVVIVPLVLLIDPPKDRCLVADYSLTPNERTAHAFYLACK
jgi:hypothetical protein